MHTVAAHGSSMCLCVFIKARVCTGFSVRHYANKISLVTATTIQYIRCYVKKKKNNNNKE